MNGDSDRNGLRAPTERDDDRARRGERSGCGGGIMAFAVTFGTLALGCANVIDQIVDSTKAQPTNPFEGVKYEHLKKDAKKQHKVNPREVDCHLANSPDFRRTTWKGTSVDQRAMEWTDAIFSALKNIGVPQTKENVEIALISIHRESRMDTNPKMSVANAFKRKKTEMIKRVRENVPTKALQDFMIRKLEAEFQKYQPQIDAADTEIEVYKVMEQIRYDFSTYARLAQNLSPADGIDEKIANVQDQVRVDTLGAMQVNPKVAVKYYAAKNRHIEYYDAVNWMFQLAPNLEVGFAILFTAIEEYEKLGYSRDQAVKFAFADYNGGLYSSRNAAFQKALSVISGYKLDTDGDLLIYEHDGVSIGRSQTELAAKSVFPELNVRQQLLYEKSVYFDNTEIYKRVWSSYANENWGKHLRVEKAIVPDADDPNAKVSYGREMTAKAYTEEAMRQVRDFKWKKCK